MGILHYGANATRVRIDDRILAHVQLATTIKLRRNEAFVLSWVEPKLSGRGRSALWLNPSVQLHWQFEGGRAPDIEQPLLERMIVEASTGRGLVLDEAQLL